MTSAKTSRDGRPRVHATVQHRDTVFGRHVEIGERVQLAECEIGDYTHIERHAEAIYATIGKFCSIAANARINALVHPMERVSQHKITYRPNEYFPHAKLDKDFRARRQGSRVVIGHDVWIGHGAVIMPGIAIGHGAVIGAGAVVTKDVAAYAVMAGVPARRIRWRFSDEVRQGLLRLAWWDWTHEQLAAAIEDMRALSAEDFLAKYLT